MAWLVHFIYIFTRCRCTVSTHILLIFFFFSCCVMSSPPPMIIIDYHFRSRRHANQLLLSPHCTQILMVGGWMASCRRGGADKRKLTDHPHTQTTTTMGAATNSRQMNSLEVDPKKPIDQTTMVMVMLMMMRRERAGALVWRRFDFGAMKISLFNFKLNRPILRHLRRTHTFAQWNHTHTHSRNPKSCRRRFILNPSVPAMVHWMEYSQTTSVARRAKGETCPTFCT